MITKTNRTGFRFVDHPWISFPVFLVFIILSMVLSGIFIFGFLKFSQDAPFSQFVQSSLGHVLMLFVFVPFVLRLPKGKTTYSDLTPNYVPTWIRELSTFFLLQSGRQSVAEPGGLQLAAKAAGVI